MPIAVVTGANSGIGNALAKILINEGYAVIAADITIGDPIKSLGCEVYELDVASSSSIEAFKQRIGERPVDMLLNVAGIMAPLGQDSLDSINLETLKRTFSINTFAPLLLTQSLLPALLASPQPKIAIMSSRMGSIADNSSGGQYAYRASKAGVNSIFKSLAVDLKPKGVTVVLLHPGIVRTNIGGGGIGAGPEGVEPNVAAEDLWKVLKGKAIEDTGRWWHRNGEELPW